MRAESMGRGALRLWPILLFTLLQQGAVFGTRPLVSLYASDLGASAAAIGVVASLYGLGAVIVSIPVGRLVDTRGGVVAARLGCSLLALSFMVTALGRSLPALAFAQFLGGVAFVTTVLATQSIIAGVGEKLDHAANYGYFATAVAVSQLVAPVTFGFLSDHLGNATAFGIAAFLVGMALLTVSIPMPRTGGPLQPAEPSEPTSLLGSASELLRMPVLTGAIISGALVQFGQDALLTFFPLYARSLALTATSTGLILSVRAFAQLLIRPFLPEVVVRFGRGRVLITSLIGGGLFSISLGAFQTVGTLITSAALAGIFIGLAQPLTMAAVAEIAPAHMRGMAFSLRMTGNRIGTLVSPLVLGLVAGPLGPAVAIWLSGGVLAVGAMAVARPLGRALSARD